MGVKEGIVLMELMSLFVCGTASSREVAMMRNEGGAGEHTDCLKSLVELRSCSNEILHYFTNGGVDLISYHCCCAISVITHNCWPTWLLNHHGYIKRRSALLQPSSLAPPVTPEVPNPLKNQQQVDLGLNATANASQESVGRNAETGGTQNGQPNSDGDNSGGRRSTSAFDRLGPGNPDPRPFGGIGSDDTQIIQELRHRMQVMEIEVKGLQKENVELKNATKDLRSRRCSPRRHRSRSKSRTPPRRRERTPPHERTPPCERTPPRRRRHRAARMTENPLRTNLGNRSESNTVVTRK
ncbi:hypothetical protein PIB30_001418 [Stylosanthes scabra]|uniref:Prolamin-like domain-containing protein n=1 Tax=Stylosanthes scabra TaxID=79078 RepID=A0ABU6Z205_9FABA|nr:hypothetical protein [Stylosanthes scabra]